jgi:hypothetical protein
MRSFEFLKSADQSFGHETATVWAKMTQTINNQFRI